MQRLVTLVLASLPAALGAQDLARLPVEPRPAAGPDWLIDPAPYRAGVYRSADGKELVLTNGLLRRAFRLQPNCATVALDVCGTSMLRGVKPEAWVELDGVRVAVGGLRGQPNLAFLRPEWVDAMTADPHAFQLTGFSVGAPAAPFAWKRVRHHDRSAAWPPKGVAVRMDYAFPGAAPAADAPRWEALRQVRVSVHYELYDGLPCVAKWITVHNGADHGVVLDRFASEVLAVVEPESRVETREGVPLPSPNLWVETDYATGGSNDNAMRWSVHWEADPDYATQVNYLRQQPCLLRCGPSVGPAQDIAPGATFKSFRSFVLLHDSWERGRNGLARRRMYRTIAPWTTENPLMMHVRHADEASVRRAVDQCAAVGFEMVILTFGSGFDIEDDAPGYLARMKGYADYAREKGVEIGGYSLLSSRRVGGGNDVVSPPGERPAHGSCPALTSAWGQRYFEKLYAFFPKTGFGLLEHDGPYPGDFDVTPRPPLQKGYADSQWAQFWISAGFYRWCRAQGIYTNTPDWYFLNGSTKCAMGYRETNWSLPRAQQVIHTRQNIFDGTWTKTPTMGWMFVPLTQYHGGGAAATVEPLSEHLEHYRLLLQCNLGAGVQACYRGPRLFDTGATEAMVREQVAWFKRHRAILESDIVHAGSRRADGRDLDWILHANPRLEDAGMLLVYNPLAERVVREIEVDVYYTGARGRLDVVERDGRARRVDVDARHRVRLPVDVAAGGMGEYRLRPVR